MGEPGYRLDALDRAEIAAGADEAWRQVDDGTIAEHETRVDGDVTIMRDPVHAWDLVTAQRLAADDARSRDGSAVIERKRPTSDTDASFVTVTIRSVSGGSIVTARESAGAWA